MLDRTPRREDSGPIVGNPEVGNFEPKMTGILIEFLMLIPILPLMALGIFAPFLALGLLFGAGTERASLGLVDRRAGTQMLGTMEL
jgi:hypothetical protein